jgi:crossover junction endonuclease MUS81
MPEPICGNPLLLSFVKEWLDKAQERNSKGLTAYKKAYNSLKACPVPFDHPSQTQSLTFIGAKLASRLTDKLKEYLDERGLPMPKTPRKKVRKRARTEDDDDDDDGPSPTKKPRKLKPYVPALKSGPYALILALSELDQDSNGLTKAALIDRAQPYCDSSFTVPADPASHYTAWSSMSNLTDKNLVYVKGRPSKKYLLTDAGWEVAERIKKTSDPSKGFADTFVRRNGNGSARNASEDESESPPQLLASPRKDLDLIPQGNPATDGDNFPPFFELVTLPPGSFTIELVLDNREVQAKQNRDYISKELNRHFGITPIVRGLPLGDMLWIAKVTRLDLIGSLGADEIILDHIIERKRLDDLVSSIKDGRFHEQKFRLRKSGIKTVIYIIEEISLSDERSDRYGESIASAIAGSQVTDGFHIQKTQKIDDTIKYLGRLHALLKSTYEREPLEVIPTEVLTAQNYLRLLKHLKTSSPLQSHHITYPAFKSLSHKSGILTVRDMFLKMLMCIKGVSGEKAIEIQKKWKTPAAFLEAYRKCGDDETGKKKQKTLVADQLKHLVGRKKVANVLSAKIADIWGTSSNSLNEDVSDEDGQEINSLDEAS